MQKKQFLAGKPFTVGSDTLQFKFSPTLSTILCRHNQYDWLHYADVKVLNEYAHCTKMFFCNEINYGLEFTRLKFEP